MVSWCIDAYDTSARAASAEQIDSNDRYPKVMTSPHTPNRTTGEGRAALLEGGVEFETKDAALLREIDKAGSIAKATSDLGRSRARALSRIETLEDAFGGLVERVRGGKDGGGSRLTENGTRLLNRYDRLQATLTATAEVPETVLEGVLTAITGELAEVKTTVGPVVGLHHELSENEETQVRIGADSVTVLDPAVEPESGATSARNRVPGVVSAVEQGETVDTVAVDVQGVTFRALVTKESTKRLELQNGRNVVITWKATATRVTRIRGGREQ